jgi:hypothetical protein
VGRAAVCTTCRRRERLASLLRRCNRPQCFVWGGVFVRMWGNSVGIAEASASDPLTFRQKCAIIELGCVSVYATLWRRRWRRAAREASGLRSRNSLRPWVSRRRRSHARFTGGGELAPKRARVSSRRWSSWGYTPNLHAQSLARQRSQAVALEYLGAVEVLADSFLVELARGVQTELVAHHYRLLLNLTGDREYRRSVLCQWVRARVVDGVILVGNPRVDPEWMDALQAENIPAVWIAYDVPQPLPPNVAVVQLDTSVGWREVVDALVAMGHRAFGYLGVDLQRCRHRGDSRRTGATRVAIARLANLAHARDARRGL